MTIKKLAELVENYDVLYQIIKRLQLLSEDDAMRALAMMRLSLGQELFIKANFSKLMQLKLKNGKVVYAK